jgi:hypothetical protein
MRAPSAATVKLTAWKTAMREQSAQAPLRMNLIRVDRHGGALSGAPFARRECGQPDTTPMMPSTGGRTPQGIFCLSHRKGNDAAPYGGVSLRRMPTFRLL